MVLVCVLLLVVLAGAGAVVLGRLDSATFRSVVFAMAAANASTSAVILAVLKLLRH